MNRAALVMAAVGLIALIGCVPVGPTAPPLVTVSVGPPTPSSATSSSVVPVATAPSSPTSSPPLGSPLSSPLGPPAIEDFGATTPLFGDSFDDPASGWGTGSTPGGDVEYTGSALQLQPLAESNWVWSYRPLDSAQNVVHVEATFTPSSAGYQGLLCANSEDQLFGAVANADGRWVFIKLTTGAADVLTTDSDPVWAIAPTIATRMALDCAGTVTGAFRMQLSRPEQGIAVRYDGGSEGPDALDRLGVYGEASAGGYLLRVDDLQAFGGAGTAP